MLVPNLIVINYPKPTTGANALTLGTIATVGTTVENPPPGGISVVLFFHPPHQPYLGHMPHGKANEGCGCYTSPKEPTKPGLRER
jgi:hypothetical protein